MNKKIISKLTLLIFFFVLYHFAAFQVIASEFSMNPMILELSSREKSGVIAIRSGEKEKQINFQVSAYEWTQDAKGDDLYTPTKDLVVFPRMLAIEPGEQRIIRVGVKGPRAIDEKTYRIYIEEIPSPREQNKQSGLGIYLRITPPVFVKPVIERASGSIEDVSFEKGKINVTVQNTGNVYFRINTTKLTGKTESGEVIFEKEIPGWYLLSGKSRTYQAAMPPDICRRLSTIEVNSKTTKPDLGKVVNVHREMCGR